MQIFSTGCQNLLDVSCECSARQMMHKKCQALFSQKLEEKQKQKQTTTTKNKTVTNLQLTIVMKLHLWQF